MYPGTAKSRNINSGCEREIVANTKQNIHVGVTERDRQADGHTERLGENGNMEYKGRR
jgi:hypothetical protein